MIIGFSGPKRSGKDFTAAKLLELCSREYYTLEKRPANYKSASFADPLREFVLDVFNMDCRHSEGYLKEIPVRCVLPTHQHVKAACQHYFGDQRPARLISSYLTSVQEPYKLLNKSYRELMVYIGTELIRNGVSQDFWVDIMKSWVTSDDYIVITDVRMENEAEFVRKHGKLIHIVNPDVEFTKEHSTEVGVDKVEGDIVFYNNPNESYQSHTLAVKELKKQLEETQL